jgi:hypothetical protein
MCQKYTLFNSFKQGKWNLQFWQYKYLYGGNVVLKNRTVLNSTTKYLPCLYQTNFSPTSPKVFNELTPKAKVPLGNLLLLLLLLLTLNDSALFPISSTLTFSDEKKGFGIVSENALEIRPRDIPTESNFFRLKVQQPG